MLLVCALTLGPHAEAAGWRERLRAFWSTCASAVSGFSPFRRELDVESIEEFARANNPELEGYPFGAEEIAALRALYAHSRDTTPLIALLVEFRGTTPPEPGRLLQRLRFEQRLLAQAANGEIPVDRWLDIPGWDGIRALWARQAPHWRPQATVGQLGSPTTGALVTSGPKRSLQFRLAPNEEPLPMVAAEEVLHIEALALLERNQAKVERWVRAQFGNILHRDFIVGTAPIDRDWVFDIRYDAKLSRIPDRNVRYVIEFLLERDAMFKKVELYRKLVAAHPELRTRRWDEILAAADPRARITELLNERYQLSAEMLRRIRQSSLDDVVRITGGVSQRFLDHEDQHRAVVPPLRWTAAEARANTPAVLQRPRFYGQELTRYAAEMPEPEVRSISEYLRTPAIAGDPYAAEEGIARAVPVYSDVGYALLLLEVYDGAHGTSHSLTEGFRLLRSMQPNGATAHHQDIFGYVAGAVRASSDRTAVKGYIDALVAAPSLFGFVSRSNSLTNLSEALGRVRGKSADAVMDPPDAAALRGLLTDFVEYHRGLGQNVADSAGNLSHLYSALSAAKLGRDYFTRVGDADNAAFFDGQARQVQSVIDLLTP